MSGSDHRSLITDRFGKLCGIVAQLRRPGGCPWDAEQSNESLLPATLEEAYEVVEAARSGSAAHFKEELGDLLLLVVMHAEIASETGQFGIAQVVEDVIEKLIRRHPHVFGQASVAAGNRQSRSASPATRPIAAGTGPVRPGPASTDSHAVVQQWEAIKREEKKHDAHYLASLPGALPALMRAEKAQKKVARVNFDWPNIADVIRKVEEELGETRKAISANHPAAMEEELGDLLFAVVNLARKCGIDAESALQKATDKFRARFNRLEDQLKAKGKKLGEADLPEMDGIWEQIKGGGS
jgi:uncharacterized protein YabN with tetrapyrrole methylase and pyrophosphatase domain